MRSFFANLAAIAAFTGLVNALTITSPSGGIVDVTRPLTITWTSTSSDPATFDLVLDNADAGSNEKIATGVSTAAGSYTLSTDALYTFGTGFVIKAEDVVGTVLATSSSFTLAQGGFVVSSDGNGSTALIATSNNGQPATSGGAEATPTNSNAEATGSSTVTGSASNTLRTSTTATHRSASSTSSSSTSSASTNAQPRLIGSNEIVLSAAGVLAGFVALIA